MAKFKTGRCHNTMIYFESPYATVSWDESLACAILAWKKYAEGEDFRTAMDKSIELLKLKKGTRWLSDLRNMRVAKLEDQNWVSHDWFKRAVELNTIKRSAMVLPTDILAQMTLQRVRSNIKREGLPDPIERRVFDNLDEAKNWLSSGE